SQFVFVSGKGKRKSCFQKLYEQARELYQRQCRYKEANEIFNGRNSYSKTDHDATFMHLKDDHMNNGQLKPAYNVQVGVESEYIISIQPFPNPTDTNTLIPFLDHLFEKLGRRYPRIIADAGYESEENYTYLKSHHQISYIKPVNYEQIKKKSYQKAIGKRENMDYNEAEDYYTCANDQKLVNSGTHIKENKKTHFNSEVTTYQCQSCENCPVKQKCTKASGNKKIQVSKNFIRLREESLENIKNDLGICLRVNRSIQAEGAFGVLKADHNFTRFLTRGNEQVLTELLLLGLSFNIRKLHTRIQNNRSDQHLFKEMVA
ncbi:transposase, partial [Turicibacter sanguinis]|nr:transposase [Turicibacter sanguinis]